MTRSIITGNNFSPHLFGTNRTLSWNPLPNFAVIRHRDQRNFQGNFDLQWKNTSARKIVACDSNSAVPPPPPPVPSEPPPPPLSPPPPSPPPPSNNSFIGQIMGLATAILGSKFGPIWMFKDKVDSTVDTVEQVVNAVENVAEQLDKVAEDFGDSLPEGKLKNLVDFVEDIAEKTADSADMIGDFIDKVQEVEDQVEDFVESIGKKPEESAKKA